MTRVGFVSTKEAVALGFNRMYLYRKRRKGRLTAYKFEDDQRTYWKLDELERLHLASDVPVVRQPPTHHQ